MDEAGRNNPRKESRVISRCLFGAALVVTLGLCGVAVVPALLQSSPPEVPGSPTDAVRDSLAGGSPALLQPAAADSDSVAVSFAVQAPPDAVATLPIDSLALLTDSLTVRGDSLALRADSLAVRGGSLALRADSLAVRGDSLAAAADSLPPAPAAARVASSASALGRRAPRPLAPGMLTAEAPSDTFGAIAAWERANSDSGSIHPLRYWQSQDPARDWLLLRLMRRMQSRYFVRSVLELRPEYFTRGDSISQVVDLRSDSLQEAGVAEGVLYRYSPSAGMRYQPPPWRSLARRDLVSRQYDVDLEHQRITRSLLHAGEKVSAWTTETYGDYLARLTRVGARAAWKEEIAASLKAAKVKGGHAGLVRISLPFEMPKAMKSIFGEGKPNLSVSGSERISFGGKSQWFPYRPAYEFQRKPSKFPQLEMKQDLTIRLKGTIGDKLDVDVDQSSEAQTSLANRIKIHYKGYEDEIVRKIDLGNTSLNLPGTEYVSYGGSHTGLFGINAESQLGGLTFNLILSKEEGENAEKTSSISSKEETKTIYDYEYVKDRFFFLDDPSRAAYADQFVVEILQGSVFLYLDNGNGPVKEDFATTPGYAVLDLDGQSPPAGAAKAGPYYFEQLQYGTDFTVLIDERNQTHPIIVLSRYLDQNSTLGVTFFDQKRQQQVGGLASFATGDTLFVRMIRPSSDLLESNLTHGVWGQTNRLMLKNVYPLQQSLENWSGDGLPENAILEDGFELTIRYRGSLDGVEDPDEIAGKRLIRHLGLDYYQDTDAGLVLGEDRKVDNVWVDFRNGYLFFPDLRPFAPGDTLRGRPGSPPWDQLPREQWNAGIYDRRSCVREHDLPGADTSWTSRYYIEVKYRTPVTKLQIDAWDIIEGSEVVTVGGRRLARDRDYRIDYQTGDISLLDEAGVGEKDEIKVTYKNAGGFGTISKTLVGAAVRYQPEDSNFGFSTSWLYEQRGSPDRRPRLGSEPTRIAVGEVAGRYTRESLGLTRLIDKLPFLDARQPSKISVEGGLGISFPNPNTRNDLYIDDFEGVADDIYVRLNRRSWKPSSLPAGIHGATEAEQAARRGEIWWYTPYRAAHEGDINPTLDYQEANDYRSVLEMQIWPYDGEPAEGGEPAFPPQESWSGIVQGLATTNMDLTRARFLDIWVNDFVPWEQFEADSSLRAGTMYIELGRVSEDALWKNRPVDCESRRIQGEPMAPGNRKLDTEDANFDGELDLSETTNEDTGLDNVLATDPADSTWDDFKWEGESETRYDEFDDLCRFYSAINGNERNGSLDTEDLDGDNGLDQDNAYFRFRVDLADTSLVETDVRRDYADKQTTWTLEANNGWRRIRVPLSDAFVDSVVGNPAWAEIKHARIWFTGLSGWKRLQIGALEIRSNRWIAEAIRDSLDELVPTQEIAATKEDFFPGVYNNKENADVYVSPFIEHRDTSNNNIREREQALTLELRNFQPGHTGGVYTPFLRDQNYMGYAAFELWLNSTLPAESDAEFFVRLCKDANIDSTDYYEYRIPVPTAAPGERRGSWLPVKIALTDLSDLKALQTAGVDTVSSVLPDGGRISIHGHPYLTKIRRITFGVRNSGTAPIENANVWIDELRLTHVNKEVDVAYRLQVRADLADIGHIDFNYKHVGSEFTSLSGGGIKQNKEEQTNYSLSASSIPIDRFLPRRLGLRMPFAFQQSLDRRVPKYRTNDDLLVGDDPTDRDVTETFARSYSLGLSRQPARSGLLKYTLDCFNLSAAVRENDTTSPYARDSTTTRTVSGSFDFPFGTLGDVKLYRNWSARWLPTSFSLGITRSEKEQARYRREGSDLSQPFVLDDARTIRSGGLSIGTGLRPISLITYNFKQSRDLMLRQKAGWLGGVNIGRETSRNEDVTATEQVRLWREWIEPRLTWRGMFRGTFNQQGSVGGGGLERFNDLTNSRTTSVSLDLPVQKLLERLGHMTRGGGDTGEEKPPEEPDAEDSMNPDGKSEMPREGEREPERPRVEPEKPSGGSGKGLGLGRLLSIGRTSGSLGLDERSTYNRVWGEPSIGYQLGLSMAPHVGRLENARDNQSQGRELGMDADFKVLEFISVTARVKDSNGKSRSAGTLTGTQDRVLPELDVRWGDVPRKLGLKGVLRTFKASTRFSRKEKTSTLAGIPTRIETNTDWSPLLDMSVTFTSGMTSTMRIERTTTHSEDMSGVAQLSDRSDTRIALSAKRTFNVTREVTVPLTKAKERITTKLDVTFGIKLDKSRNVTQQRGQPEHVAGDNRRFDVDLTGNYQFSRSVTGQVSLNVGENADNKNNTRTARYAGVMVSASFSF
jgi:hypothetical protein